MRGSSNLKHFVYKTLYIIKITVNHARKVAQEHEGLITVMLKKIYDWLFRRFGEINSQNLSSFYIILFTFYKFPQPQKNDYK